MLKRILCVDDEANMLQAFERQFRDKFEIQTAIGPGLGLQRLAADGPFAVVVSDLRMPIMDGIEFLIRVRQASPNTVRVMLTGHADLRTAAAAVNEGKIFQFLTKPCPPDVLGRTLESAVEQYRLTMGERELLEQTLRGSIGVLSEILSLVNPPAFSRAQRICRCVRHIAEKLKLKDSWQYEVAAMLSQIGCVTVPTDILDKVHRQHPLSASEQQILNAQSRVGHDLLARIPRLQSVAEMVAYQASPWSDLTGAADPVRIGANLLKTASDFDEQVMRGNSVDSVLSEMYRNADYHSGFVASLQQLQAEDAKREIRLVRLSQLRPHMIINVGVYSITGLLLLAKGQIVTDSAIARLDSFASLFGIVEPISVIVPHGEPEEELLEAGVYAEAAQADHSFSLQTHSGVR